MVSGKCEPDIDLSNFNDLQLLISGKCELDRDLSNYDGLQSVVWGECEPDMAVSVTMVCSQWYLGSVN